MLEEINKIRGERLENGLPSSACNCPEAAIQSTESLSPDDGFYCVLHCQSMKLQPFSFINSCVIQLLLDTNKCKTASGHEMLP